MMLAAWKGYPFPKIGWRRFSDPEKRLVESNFGQILLQNRFMVGLVILELICAEIIGCSDIGAMKKVSFGYQNTLSYQKVIQARHQLVSIQQSSSELAKAQNKLLGCIRKILSAKKVVIFGAVSFIQRIVHLARMKMNHGTLKSTLMVL